MKTLLRFLLKGSGHSLDVVCPNETEAMALKNRVEALVKAGSSEVLSGSWRDEKVGVRHYFVAADQVAAALTVDWDALQREQQAVMQAQMQQARGQQPGYYQQNAQQPTYWGGQ